MIRSGGGHRPKVKVGGRMIVVPIFHKLQRISLEVMTLLVETRTVYTKEGVAVSVDGVAQVKVATSEEAIRTAAQQFLDKTDADIADVALQTLEGHQRSILGTMTVEQIYQDRDTFAQQVRDVASPDMANMGLEIVSFTIRNIQDEEGYLEALGVGRTAEVKRDAAIGVADAERDAAIRGAEARRDSLIAEAEADRDAQGARFLADAKIAESQRDFSVEKAAFDQEVNAREAEAALAGPLQDAKTRQEVRSEEVQIDVVERRKQIEVEEQEIERRERELDASIRRPAEAERFRLETIATGDRFDAIAEAEAEQERLRLLGLGEADAIRAKGEAEADATRAQGLAEAEAMRVKAEAWKQYGQAAVIDKLLESLPEIAEAIAQPLAKTDRIVMISGGNDTSMGASRITGEVTQIIAQLPEIIESLTGIDILAMLKELPGVATTDGPEANDSSASMPGTVESADLTSSEESPEAPDDADPAVPDADVQGVD